MRAALFVVFVSSTDHTVRSFEVLHEQDRSASAISVRTSIGMARNIVGTRHRRVPIAFAIACIIPSRADAARRDPDAIAQILRRSANAMVADERETDLITVTPWVQRWVEYLAGRASEADRRYRAQIRADGHATWRGDGDRKPSY